MTHRCAALMCTSLVPDDMLMCKSHWFALPSEIRVGIYNTYKRGQSIHTASPRYIEHLRAAQRYLANRQARGDSSAYLGKEALDE